MNIHQNLNQFPISPPLIRPAFGPLDSELRAAFGTITESSLSYKVKSHGATLESQLVPASPGGSKESQLAAGYNSMADSLGGMINNSVVSSVNPSSAMDLDKYRKMEKFLTSALCPREEVEETHHRYQNSDSAGFHGQAVDVRPYGLALYNFVPQFENELGFKKGEMIFLLQHVDSDWMEGELDCQQGIFPRSYVTIVVDCPDLVPGLEVGLVAGSEYRVVFTFTGEREGDLTVVEGDLVTILSQTDHHWCLVRDSRGQTGLCPLNHLNTCPQSLPTSPSLDFPNTFVNTGISNLVLPDIKTDSTTSQGHSLKFFDPLCSPDEEMLRLESELIRRAAERPRVPINHEVRLHTNLNLGNLGGAEEDKMRSKQRFKSSLAAGWEGKPNIDSFISQNLDGLKEIKAPLFSSTTANSVPSSSTTETGGAVSAPSNLPSDRGRKSFTISDSIREELLDKRNKPVVPVAAVRRAEEPGSEEKDSVEEFQEKSNNEPIYLPMCEARADKGMAFQATTSSSTLCSSESVYARVNKKRSRKKDEVFYHSVDVTSRQSDRHYSISESDIDSF